MVELTQEEYEAGRAALPTMRERLRSLKEDVEAGLPVQGLIDDLERGVRVLEHALKKYGPKQAPRR